MVSIEVWLFSLVWISTKAFKFQTTRQTTRQMKTHDFFPNAQKSNAKCIQRKLNMLLLKRFKRCVVAYTLCLGLDCFANVLPFLHISIDPSRSRFVFCAAHAHKRWFGKARI